jgi:hypothetical protein
MIDTKKSGLTIVSKKLYFHGMQIIGLCLLDFCSLFSSPLIIKFRTAKKLEIAPFLKNFIFIPRLRSLNLTKKELQL